MPEGVKRVRRATAATHSEQQEEFVADVGSGMKSFRHHGGASRDAASHILANCNRGISKKANENYSVGTRRHLLPTLAARKKMPGFVGRHASCKGES